MTTHKQDANFIATVISKNLLQDAIDWIAATLSPEDVFSETDLETWAEDNGYRRKGS